MYSRFTDRSILPRIKVLSYKFFFFKGSIFREIFSIYRAIKIHTRVYDTISLFTILSMKLIVHVLSIYDLNR